MSNLTRWFAPAVLAAALGLGATAPAPAQAQDSLTRVLVDIADVVFNNGTPYYRYGDYRTSDRLVVGRDRYGRPLYYRVLPYNAYPPPVYTQRVVVDRYGRPVYDRYGRRVVYAPYVTPRPYYVDNRPPYGNAYGYYRDRRDVTCNRHGKCEVNYYDRRYDRDGHRR